MAVVGRALRLPFNGKNPASGAPAVPRLAGSGHEATSIEEINSTDSEYRLQNWPQISFYENIIGFFVLSDPFGFSDFIRSGSPKVVH
jgi:hypothetical protein